MKTKLFLFITLLIGLSSCIKDEPLYREADIVEMVVRDDAFLTSGITENTVQLIITDQADYSKITPEISLSPGATATPSSGETVDFSQGNVTYRVTAEDGKHYKDYTVSIVPKISLKHGFEEWTTDGTGKATHPILTDALWANANKAVGTLMALGIRPLGEFPTDKTTDCVEGEYAAIMQTMKGGFYYGRNYPIFSGSLFRGAFSLNIFNALKSLHLGQVHPIADGTPTIFNGYFKYTPGSVFTDKDENIIEGRIDKMSIYAVIFKVTKDASITKEYLDGETILTSDRIIARAEWKENDPSITLTEAKNGFTKFSIPFVYTENMDYEKYDYRLTIVCSSSKDGNEYMGAIGSTLIVDELEIICDPIQ